MLDNVKKLASTPVFTRGGKSAQPTLNAKDVAQARAYIANYWKNLERFHPKDDDTLLGLPNPYLVPASEAGHDFDFNEMYYWDSYFMVQGMFDTKHKKLVVGILENLLYLQQKYGAIPNASRMYLTGRSQPPLLTTFIFEVYDAYAMSDSWLANAIEVAKVEYEKVWMGVRKPHNRKVHNGLSRYYDINMLDDLAEAESGWDMTPRFNRRALDYLPVDLNSLLYKYETDFARAAEIAGDAKGAKLWRKTANARAKTIDELLWSNLRNFYYDYNYKKQKRGAVASLAGFYPLWAGMVDAQRAEKLVKALRKFEQKGGLVTTDVPQISQKFPGAIPTQWAYPNGWAPLQYLIIKGLERYGYHDDARRIARKWLKTNNDWFSNNGVFLEKYNVVNPEKPPVKGVYPSQVGFGWTNAIFERLCKDYIDG